MKYLLDSNTISDIYNPSAENHQRFIKRILALKENDDAFISILTLYEFEYALANAPIQKKTEIKTTLWQIQQDFMILPLSASAAEFFGELKKSLKELRNIKPENLKKHTIDLMIAADALNHHAALVSADKIYQDIQLITPELNLENWVAI